MGPSFRWKGIPFGNFPKLRERGAPLEVTNDVTSSVCSRFPSTDFIQDVVCKAYMEGTVEGVLDCRSAQLTISSP
ncbi:hypothetical protein O181_031710 [Austropuccinia psidii MF-1]|uniref:Uncharacterized protein n=1 Tax=Austropuccinia psidii MF-1 TaxID=1389203 RepID=A0A9Q3H7I3_9BASI|nr:hypothetical protein [Austropuccinia psidii MF-1]